MANIFSKVNDKELLKRKDIWVSLVRAGEGGGKEKRLVLLPKIERHKLKSCSEQGKESGFHL